MNDDVHKTDDHLNGVRCVVNSCYYHVRGDYCSASQIEIAPRNANEEQETDCHTYTSGVRL